jgi:hypothetical protein
MAHIAKGAKETPASFLDVAVALYPPFLDEVGSALVEDLVVLES